MKPATYDQDIRNHLIVLAATDERPRLYPTAVLNAENFDPSTRRAHIKLSCYMERLDRSEAQANRYKQRNRDGSKEHKGQSSTGWDETGFDNMGTYSTPTGSTEGKLADDSRTADAVKGFIPFHPAPLLGDADRDDVLDAYGVTLLDADRFDFDDPAVRVQKAGMSGGPVAALFNASITHKNPTDAWLTAQLLVALIPSTGQGRVRIESLMKALGMKHRESLIRKAKRINRWRMLDVYVDGDYLVGEPTAAMCAVWEAWASRQPIDA